jgi:HAE1 family hydrophobic/amphiphilic exporter-1
MGGITGLLYQQFAITIAISVLFSAFNALTLSPALAAMLLKPSGGKKSPLDKFYKWFNKHFDRFTGSYLSFTGILVRKVSRSMIFIGIILVLTVLLFKGVPGGFVPEEDNGYFLINVQLPDASSLQRTDIVCKKIEDILAKTKGIDNYTTVAGFSLISGVASSNNAFFFVSMKPWEERTETEERSFETIEALNKIISAEVPEAFVAVFGPPAIQGLGTGAGFTLMLQDKSGNTPQELAAQVNNFINEAKKRPEIGRISTLFRPSVPQIYAEVNRDKVLKLGVTIADVNTTLGSLLGSNYINDFNRFGRVYKVYLSAEGDYRNETWDLGQYFVRNNNGSMVPLNTLVTMKPSNGPEYTNRFNLFRSAELTGIPAPGYTSSQAITALEEVAAQVLTQGYGYDWANMSYQEVKAAGSGATVFIFALLFVFLILAAQYESWTLPLSVLLGIPFAVFGGMLGLFAARFFSESYVNNVFAQIGFVTLIGLAAKNAILIVEFAKMKKEEGMDVAAAALDAAKLRLRPILMTSFAFILGVLPLVRATGAGAESRKVMGMAVFAGLLVATTLAIYTVPSLYVMVEKYLIRDKKTKTPSPITSSHHSDSKEKGE